MSEPLTREAVEALALDCEGARDFEGYGYAGVTLDKAAATIRYAAVTLDKAAATIRALRDENDALRKDKERLDWIETSMWTVNGEYWRRVEGGAEVGWACHDNLSKPDRLFGTAREAIDAAREGV